MADETLVIASDSAPQAAPPVDPNAPPKWTDIQVSPAYRSLDTNTAMHVYQNWVKDTQAYLDANNKPTVDGETPVQAAATQNAFNQYAQEQAQKNFGMGIPLNDKGKLLTRWEDSQITGKQLDLPQDANDQFAGNINLPVMLKQQANPGDAFTSGLSHLFTTPAIPIAAAYDYITNTQPGSTNLDKGLALLQQKQRDIAAAAPSGIEGTLTNTIPNAAGGLASTVMGGGAGTLGKVGLKSLAGMAGFAAADSSSSLVPSRPNRCSRARLGQPTP